MKHLRRLLPILLLAALLLTGCQSTGAEELYSLPRRSDIYLELQQAIEFALDGAAYAAPISGENQRAIQQADLDGDGTEEILVFARADGEKPLRIHILRKADQEYTLLCTLEGDGNAFDSAVYAQIDGAPGLELVVSRRLAELQSVSVYTFAGGEAAELLSRGCVGYTLTDLNADGLSDVFLLLEDPTRTNGIAEYYRWQDGTLARDVEADMSASADSVKRIITGRMTDTTPAVFVASAYDDANIITDVYAVVNGGLHNVSLSDESGLSTGTVRSYFVYSTDIDGDGVIELPATVELPAMPDDERSQGQYRIVWYNLNPDGTRSIKCSTFHNYAEGWYLQLPSQWLDTLSVTTQAPDGSAGTCLLTLRKPGSYAVLLTVCVLTSDELAGEDAARQLEAGKLVLLARRGDNCYCARCGEAFDIDISELQSSFGFITTDIT